MSNSHRQGPATVVAIPPNRNQEMVLVPEERESKGSKFKSFFTGGKKKAKIVLSPRDAEILAQVKRRAKVLDTAIDLGVAKIGLDPILGLIPIAGDAITLAIAMRLIHTAQKADIPKSLTHQMLFNVMLDFGMGLVPVVGDIADFLFKANQRNAKLFEDFLYERAAAQAAEAEQQAATKAHHDQLHQQAAANFAAGTPGYQQQPQQQQQPPAKKGWFSRGGGGQTVVEMGPSAGHPIK
ncbi:hypothetical protein BGZ96_001654 [Linnemannia gamsii]|uniref:DUF4112 domain-containing protein n=1 Tax=Linnemannia gamsii TaxID=64522 RepID=A0ABQ7JLV6_9FUNG|nr:hypothetical protein BGZ96_001654 [Linnemannia gamsii]